MKRLIAINKGVEVARLHRLPYSADVKLSLKWEAWHEQQESNGDVLVRVALGDTIEEACDSLAGRLNAV